MSKSRFLLHVCMMYLIVLATAAQGFQIDKPLSQSAALPAKCSNEIIQSLPKGRVQFVQGLVFDQRGQQIEVGLRLAATDQITVGIDGFLSLHLSDGSVLNIQPNSHTTIACELQAPTTGFAIKQPYLVGAIRG